MAAQVLVLLGPVRSGKTYELVRRYRSVLEIAPQTGLDRAIWLAPNGRAATDVREQLVRSGLSACLRPGVITFDDLTDQVLTASNVRLRSLDPILQRELIRRVVEQAVASGTLTFFADAAGRPGFLDLLAEHFAELQRRNIRSEAYARTTSQRASAQQQTELAQLYADYESLSGSHGLVDRESAHEAARTALAKNICPRFQHLDLIVSDGFTDFTGTQQEIFRLLAARAKQLLISLPADNVKTSSQTARYSHQSTRPDLFAKTAATLRELQHHFPHLEVRQFDPRPLTNPAIDHIAQNIFGHPKQIPIPSPAVLDSLARIEIVEAAGAQDEVVQIARRIKKLLTANPLCTNPNDIHVVFRSLTGAAPRIREVFDSFGIPFYLDATSPIATAPVIKTLLSILRLEQEDWRFRRVVAVLTDNTIRAFTDDARRAADWLVRDLQIASGRTALLTRTQGLADDPTPPNDRSEYLDRRIAAAIAALPALSQLASALQALPEKATPTEWCDALSRLGTQLGLGNGWHALSPSEGRGGSPSAPRPSKTQGVPPDEDHAAWHCVIAHLAALERLDAWLGQPPCQLSLSELLTTLRAVATKASLPRAHGEAGRVRVLTAPAARNISAKHLFLAGMSEQAFPSPEPAGRLATDADYRHLVEAADGKTASAPVSAATRAQAEMLLFYEVVSRADESLTISYPALDDKAQTLPPSPYVVELERLFSNEQSVRIHCAKPQLSPVPSDSTPYSIADWRMQAVAHATDKEADRRLLAGIFSCEETKPLAGAIDAGLRIVHARARGESFGPSEGLLTSPAIAERLAQRFGPQHAWSASQWETYAACPFRFFMQHVLRLEPLGDLVLETDFARRGSRLHDVLATFHRQWLTIRGERPLLPDEEAAAFLAHLQQVANERTSAPSRVGVEAALLELDRRQILKWANHHFDNQTKYDAGYKTMSVPMTPTHFEFRFGPARRGDSHADPNSTINAFVLKIDGEAIQITGQIDRIDVGTVDGKRVFNVIDYKSGRRASLKREQLETGEQLQLPIYVEAAQALVFKNEAAPYQAAYWGMASGFDAKGALAAVPNEQSGSHWPDTHNAVHQLIKEFIDGIRRGNFPVASRDDKCTSTCDFHMTCRVAQVRSLHKTWWPEITQPK